MYALPFFTAGTILLAAATTWSRAVRQQLGDVPYMDEIFHIPQAQAYCDGRFSHWDSKITTPPGLYLASYAASLFTRDCHSPVILRGLNVAALGVVFWGAYALLETPLAFVNRPGKKLNETNRTITALSIALFPPLFFFSGLYYTDVMSTALVLVHLRCCFWYISHIQNADASQRSVGVGRRTARQALIVTCGLLAVLCRQTNIFWVAIFPAAVTALEVLKGSPNSAAQLGVENPSWNSVISEAWKHSRIHNPRTADASITSVAKFLFSVAIASVNRWTQLLTHLGPYITLLGIFSAFVALNGSVVLGDKSNHVVTLHFAQIFYLSTCIVVFSFPAFVPLILFVLKQPRRIVPKTHSKLATCALLVLGGLAGIAMVVHFNTIVHPFTLADNRHFIFYIFRIFRLWPWARYAVIPTYLVSMVAIWKSYGWWPRNIEAGICEKNAISPIPVLTAGAIQIADSESEKLLYKQNGPNHSYSHSISVPVILIATSVLSIVTAPLVEPRYFIIPWILWRLTTSRSLLLPFPALESSTSSSTRSDAINPCSSKQANVPLGLEVLWFTALNIVVGHLFLHRPFRWEHAPDDGLQRFLW